MSPRELRVFYTFLNILRSICSGHGYSTQRAAKTSCPRLVRPSRRGWLLALSDAKHGTAAGDGLLLFGEFQVAVGEFSPSLLEFVRGGGGVDGVGGQCPVGQDGHDVVANLGEAAVHVVALDGLL